MRRRGSSPDAGGGSPDAMPASSSGRSARTLSGIGAHVGRSLRDAVDEVVVRIDASPPPRLTRESSGRLPDGSSQPAHEIAAAGSHPEQRANEQVDTD